MDRPELPVCFITTILLLKLLGWGILSILKICVKKIVKNLAEAEI